MSGCGIDVERVNIVINYDCPRDADRYLRRVGYVIVSLFVIATHCLCRRAGRFGTKGLAITFLSSDSDQQVMAWIQLRFEVAVPELPDRIDPASYMGNGNFSSDSDQQVMATIQSRFEIAVPELPDHIDPASYIQHQKNGNVLFLTFSPF